MAIQPATFNRDVSPRGGLVLITWAALGQADTGSPVNIGEHGTKTFQISGVFGAAGSVTIEGSNDATNWVTLVDSQGNALTFTAAGMKTARDMPVHVRPHTTVGDGTTAIVVSAAARRADISVTG